MSILSCFLGCILAIYFLIVFLGLLLFMPCQFIFFKISQHPTFCPQFLWPIHGFGTPLHPHQLHQHGQFVPRWLSTWSTQSFYQFFRLFLLNCCKLSSSSCTKFSFCPTSSSDILHLNWMSYCTFIQYSNCQFL